MVAIRQVSRRDSEKKRLLLIGFGPHARRIYFPSIIKFSEKMNFELVAAVDLQANEEVIRTYLAEQGVDIPLLLVPPELQTYDALHPKIEAALNRIVKKQNVTGVIIATEPLVHVMYAKWALGKDLSIIMDKPVSTYQGISTEKKLAKRLLTDFEELAALYKEAKERNQNLTFSLMAQRRFHPAFQKIRELIKDCFGKTNCPITSIQTFHCDGQWRMPTEIVEQLYHPYKQGYGKCSHSGYHFFDIVPYMLEAGLGGEKYYDNIEVMSSFVRPLDFMEQMPLEDYERLFGSDEFRKHNNYSKEDLEMVMDGFGEIDAFTNIAFKKGKRTMTVASINLAHNGFARRHWPTAAGRDLYKGNGRVRHEFHILEQGPFQSIHYHSYQSCEVDSAKKSSLYEVGGEYHLEIYVFRNTKMIGGEAIQVFNIKDLNINILDGKSRGHQEDARALGFIEFIEALHGVRRASEMTSDFLSHQAAVLITAGIYQSAVAQLYGENPLVKLPFLLNGLDGVKIHELARPQL